jgi:hypothetical protein
MSSAIRHRPLPLVLALLLGLTLSQVSKAAAPPAKTPQRKLSVQVLITAPPAQGSRSAQKPPGSGPASPPKPIPIKVAERSKPLAAVVYFKDCQPNAAGNCNVDMDFYCETSKGVRFGDTKKAPLWRDRPAPKPGINQAGPRYIGLTFEPSDPPGTYKVFVVAHDRNSGAESKAETSFELK